MKVQGRRTGGRSKRRWLDRVSDDINEKGLSGEEASDRATRRRMSSYIDPHKSGNKLKRRTMRKKKHDMLWC